MILWLTCKVGITKVALDYICAHTSVLSMSLETSLTTNMVFKRKQDSRINLLLDCHICKRKHIFFFLCRVRIIYLWGVVVAVMVVFCGFFSIQNFEHDSNFIFHFLIFIVMMNFMGKPQSKANGNKH